MAYEGNNLYVQVVRFDNVLTFHQPLSGFYMADAMEMEINGFFSGYKY